MTTQAFTPPQRTLMGPGPSDVPPSVLEAMGQSLVGHLDPSFVTMMEEIKDMLRQVFLTENEMTFPISGTGSAGMEFCFTNLIEPGDEVVIGINGVFGTRMADVAARAGGKGVRLRAPELAARVRKLVETGAMTAAGEAKLLAAAHAEFKRRSGRDAASDGDSATQSGAEPAQ